VTVADSFRGFRHQGKQRLIVVIEINDNPNLEHGVEDQVGKDEVWTRS
jgi:hypothetical protein